jgi:hypothetical protein
MANGSGRYRRLLESWRRCRLVAFLLFGLAFVDVLVHQHRHVWKSYDPRVYRDRLNSCRQRPWDLVLVGSSPVMCGMNTDVLAGVCWRGQRLERVYNLGLPLATAAEIYWAVEHALIHPPRLLIYGMTLTDFNEDRVEPQGPGYLMDAGDVVRWCRGRPEATGWCLRQFLQEHLPHIWKLYYYREGIRLWAASCLDQWVPGWFPEAAAEAETNRRRSAILRSGRGLAPFAPAPTKNRLDCLKAAGACLSPCTFLENFGISGYLAYFHRLLDWAHDHQVPILLVNMPVCADTERLHATELAAYRAMLAEEERTRGVHVLCPTREAIGLTDADFQDHVHLNGDGNARFSAWLRRVIAQIDTQGSMP